MHDGANRFERSVALRKKDAVGLVAQILVGGKDASGLLAPVVVEATIDELVLDRRKRVQEKLAVVAEGEGILAREAASDLVEEDFAESEIDGGGGLKVADGVEDIGSEKFAVGDATHLATEMEMAEGSVAGINGGSAAFAVGAKTLAATIGNGSQ